MCRRLFAFAGAFVASMSMSLATAVPDALAAPGDVLAEVATGSTAASAAFDGQHVYFTDLQGTALSRVSPTGGGRVDVPIVGAVGVNAIAYDASRDSFWAVDATGLSVYLLGRDGIARLQFVINPVTDLPDGCGTLTGCSPRVTGLAYDATDDTLWYAPDASARVYQLTSVGQPLGHVALVASPGCTPATGGVAAGGSSIYVADKGCGRLVQYGKTGGVISSFVAAGLLGDVSCDDVSFSRHAAWVRDQTDGRIRALEIRPNTCVYGGGVDFRPITAWMTGGGSTPARDVRNEATVYVAHFGFRINCPTTTGIVTPNRLTIVWEADFDGDGRADERHRFHLVNVLTQDPGLGDAFVASVCAPTELPNPPAADFSLMEGTGAGRLDGGRCTGAADCAYATWEFVDRGEPPFMDGVELRVFSPTLDAVLESRCLVDGNIQAHGTNPRAGTTPRPFSCSAA